jgi:hypothetical protein
MNRTRKTARRNARNSDDNFDAIAPVIRSAVGVIREGTGLLCNVMRSGLQLVSEAKVEPRQPNALSANIFSFPTTRPTKRTK